MRGDERRTELVPLLKESLNETDVRLLMGVLASSLGSPRGQTMKVVKGLVYNVGTMHDNVKLDGFTQQEVDICFDYCLLTGNMMQEQ